MKKLRKNKHFECYATVFEDKNKNHYDENGNLLFFGKNNSELGAVKFYNSLVFAIASAIKYNKENNCSAKKMVVLKSIIDCGEIFYQKNYKMYFSKNFRLFESDCSETWEYEKKKSIFTIK